MGTKGKLETERGRLAERDEAVRDAQAKVAALRADWEAQLVAGEDGDAQAQRRARELEAELVAAELAVRRAEIVQARTAERVRALAAEVEAQERAALEAQLSDVEAKRKDLAAGVDEAADELGRRMVEVFELAADADRIRARLGYTGHAAGMILRTMGGAVSHRLSALLPRAGFDRGMAGVARGGWAAVDGPRATGPALALVEPEGYVPVPDPEPRWRAEAAAKAAQKAADSGGDAPPAA